MQDIKQEYREKVNICWNHIINRCNYLGQLLDGMEKDAGTIPEAAYTRAVESTGEEIKQFAIDLQTLSRQYLEYMDKEKVVYKDGRRQFTEAEEMNGRHAVECMESETARNFYNSGAVKVYEYHNPEKGAPLDHWTLYAYTYKNEYAEGLTEKEMEETLIKLSENANKTNNIL